MSDVKEEWKAFPSWEKVKGEYLDKWYSSCEKLALVITVNQLGGGTDKVSRKVWQDFFTDYYNILMLASVKISKIPTYKGILIEHIDAMVTGGRLSIKEYFDALMAIGDMLDELGYNSPEQKKRTSTFLSDLGDNYKEPQGEEMNV